MTQFEFVSLRLRRVLSIWLIALLCSLVFLSAGYSVVWGNASADFNGFLSSLIQSVKVFLWPVEYDAPPNISFVLPLAFISSLILAKVYVGYFQPKEDIVSGSRLVRKSISEVGSAVSKQGKQGLQLNDSGLKISGERETNHFFIVGSPGSGKTQLILPWMEKARARGDKVIIYDNKGDFTESLKQLQSPLHILAPWDKRTVAWRIGEDIFNKQLARELASRMIPDGEEPLFSNSARMLLVGAVVFLQKTKGTSWGVPDLIDVLVLPQPEIYQIMREHAKEVAEIVKESTKLTQNIFTNLLSAIAPLMDLAEAWKDAKESISVRQLIAKDSPFTLVLQGSGVYSFMASSLHRSIIGAMSAEIESLPDDGRRRIWFFLDEFPQLGDMPGIVPMLEIGRSKGVCVVIACQNLNQMTHIYGAEVSSSIMAMCQTHVYGRTSLGETANKLVEFMGEQEVSKLSPKFDDNGNIEGFSVERFKRNAVTQDFLASELGVKKDGIDMIFSGFGRDIYLSRIPFYTREKFRTKNHFAKWTGIGS